MVEPDEQINPAWTVGELIETLEGHDFLPTDPDEDHFLCDFCSTGVPYSSKPRVGGYVADMVLNTDHPKWRRGAQDQRPLVPLASYCDDCSTRLLMFPCKGYSEVRTFFHLDEDMVMQDVEVTDLSPRDDGIPWDPKDLSEKITEVPFEDNVTLGRLLGEDYLWGPENIVTFFLSVSSDVDIREVVKWDGSLNPRPLGLARRRYDEFQQKMNREGHGRRAFRDHVREER